MMTNNYLYPFESFQETIGLIRCQVNKAKGKSEEALFLTFPFCIFLLLFSAALILWSRDGVHLLCNSICKSALVEIEVVSAFYELERGVAAQSFEHVPQ